MKKIFRLASIIAMAVFYCACDDEEVYSPDERFVLQAYLYANEPVWDISLKNAVPLTVADSVGEPINDAKVKLIKNGKTYNLVLQGDSGYYAYPGNDLNVLAGDVFKIEATSNGMTATGETVVPEPPAGAAISQNVVEIPEITLNTTGFPDMGQIRELLTLMTDVKLSVVWNNPNNELHFVVIENNEQNQESIFPVGNRFGRGNRGAFRRISRPTREDNYLINFGELTFWGQYVVKVYRVNQEYADLYENLTQDSRDLNEPPTNIKNGLGIFSAFNSQRVYFRVVKKQ